MVDNTPMSNRKCDHMCLMSSESYVGLDSMYVKVSGVMMGARVGVFVGIIVNRVEYDKYLVGWLRYGVVLYSARFYSQ